MPLFLRNNVEIHRMEILPGTHCSKHRHLCKFNMFFVESGVLGVRIWKNSYNLVDEVRLLHGESCVIPPGEFHQFFVEGNYPVTAYEIYWTELSPLDIQRDGVGGAD